MTMSRSDRASGHPTVNLDRLKRHGLQPSFLDAFGRLRETSPATLRRLEGVFRDLPEAETEHLVVAPGQVVAGLAGTLRDARGSREIDGVIPSHLPSGLYHLDGPVAGPRTVVVAPPVFPTPPRGWGLSVQLYAAASDRSWGIGDLTDLAAICRRAADLGAGSVLVNPLGAVRPGGHPEPSPYSPASRNFLNLLHLDPDSVPGAERVDLTDLREQARQLNRARLIDRGSVWNLKLAALERIWETVRRELPEGFERYQQERGEALELFATWSVLAERHRGPWWSWPSEARSSQGAGLEPAAEERRLFWMWCQWVTDQQLEAVCEGPVDLVVDGAVGFDAGGFDAWRYQDLLELDFELGCPADIGNPGGQRWGLPPFNPTRLAADDYRPLRETYRALLRHGAGLRIDHVMGLWRLWWVPRGSTDADGAYLRSDGGAILGLLRAEVARTGRPIWVVGEDMGTVEEVVREAMTSARMLSYRVLGRVDPESVPEHSMAAIATHDQPTLVGLLTGSDLEDCARIDKPVNPDRWEQNRARILRLAGLDPHGPPPNGATDEAVVEVHRALAETRARVTLASLEDLAGVACRPNMPGVVARWPSWQQPLPLSPLDILSAPTAERVAEVFSAAGRERAASRPDRSAP